MRFSGFHKNINISVIVLFYPKIDVNDNSILISNLHLSRTQNWVVCLRV